MEELVLRNVLREDAEVVQLIFLLKPNVYKAVQRHQRHGVPLIVIPMHTLRKLYGINTRNTVVIMVIRKR
jgi:hypothetical protein